MIRSHIATYFVYTAFATIAAPAAASPRAVLTPGWGAIVACYSADAGGRAYRAVGPRSQWRKVQDRSLAACRGANPSHRGACRLVGCR